MVNNVKEIDKCIESHELAIEKLILKKRSIQSECSHDYYLRSKGMYEDTFCCIHCLHNTERPPKRNYENFWDKYNEIYGKDK